MTGHRPGWMAPGRSRVSAFVTVPDAIRVVRFAEHVFEAVHVRPPLHHADGRLWNAEIAIGDCTILLGDAEGGMVRPAFLYVHVPDALATFAKAVEAGATPVSEPENRFYGDLDGGVTDPAGNIWWIASHVEDVDPDEIERRARAMEGR
jgi:PhnB protein